MAYEVGNNEVKGVFVTVQDGRQTRPLAISSGPNKAKKRGVHAAEDWVDEGTHSLAARFDHVPAMGPAARMMADRVTMGTQLLGGIGLGVTTMVGGMAHSVVHPIDTALGLEAMLEMGQISSIKLWSEQPEPRRKDQEELLGIPRGRSLALRSTMSACPIARPPARSE